MFEILDDDGVIYSGSSEEMEDIFDEMLENSNARWEGDLKLVQVLKVER